MNTKEHARLKVHLKMSVTRLRNIQQKKTALAKANRREIAGLLSQGKEASARIRVENIIREDINVELLEILELYCELLLARIGLLDTKVCDPGLEEAVKSLMYSATRSEVKELVTLRQMFTFKYGKQFEADALENVDDKVNAKVIAKLSVQPPPGELVSRYLHEIARTYHVNWHDGTSSSDDEDDQPGSGALPETDDRLPDTPVKNAAALVNVALPSPTSENPRPRLHVPQDQAAPKKKKEVESNRGTEDVDDQSFDALMARFDKLKRG